MSRLAEGISSSDPHSEEPTYSVHAPSVHSDLSPRRSLHANTAISIPPPRVPTPSSSTDTSREEPTRGGAVLSPINSDFGDILDSPLPSVASCDFPTPPGSIFGNTDFSMRVPSPVDHEVSPKRGSFVFRWSQIDASDSIGILPITLPTIPEEGLSLCLAPSALEPNRDSDALPLLTPSYQDDQTTLCDICGGILDAGESYCVSGIWVHRCCLRCANCGTPINPPSCISYGGLCFCMNCGSSDIKKVCAVCELPLGLGEVPVALPDNLFAHSTCIACFECNEPIIDFEILAGERFCLNCAAKICNRKCQRCNSVIVHDHLLVGCKWFHRDCFTCHECNALLKGHNFVSHHGRFYCQEHGHPFESCCQYCKETIWGLGPQIRWSNKLYHPECFVCRVCGVKLTMGTVRRIHNRPHCEQCASAKAQGVQNRKHNPSEAAHCNQGIASRIAIVNRPKYRTEEMGPPLETVDRAMNAKEFEPPKLKQ
jgi:hypothetical protein